MAVAFPAGDGLLEHLSAAAAVVSFLLFNVHSIDLMYFWCKTFDASKKKTSLRTPGGSWTVMQVPSRR